MTAFPPSHAANPSVDAGQHLLIIFHFDWLIGFSNVWHSPVSVTPKKSELLHQQYCYCNIFMSSQKELNLRTLNFAFIAELILTCYGVCALL